MIIYTYSIYIFDMNMRSGSHALLHLSLLLDLVEVTQLHSGLNLAAAFAKVLDKIGISSKVSML